MSYSNYILQIYAMGETGRQKFVRLANSRVNKAIKQIDLIGNLSNRSNYEYEDEDVDQIFRAIRSALKDARTRFESEKRDDSTGFRLGE